MFRVRIGKLDPNFGVKRRGREEGDMGGGNLPRSLQSFLARPTKGSADLRASTLAEPNLYIECKKGRSP